MWRRREREVGNNEEVGKKGQKEMGCGEEKERRWKEYNMEMKRERKGREEKRKLEKLNKRDEIRKIKERKRETRSD